MKRSTVRSKIILNTVRLILVLVLNVIFYVLVAVAIANVSSMAYEYSYQIFGNVTVQEPPGTDVDFQINEGESTMSVASRLEHNRLVVNRYTFFIRAKLATMEGSSIKPGEFALNTSLTYTEILDVITESVTDRETENAD